MLDNRDTVQPTKHNTLSTANNTLSTANNYDVPIQGARLKRDRFHTKVGLQSEDVGPGMG